MGITFFLIPVFVVDFMIIWMNESLFCRLIRLRLRLTWNFQRRWHSRKKTHGLCPFGFGMLNFFGIVIFFLLRDNFFASNYLPKVYFRSTYLQPRVLKIRKLHVLKSTFAHTTFCNFSLSNFNNTQHFYFLFPLAFLIR